MVCSRGINGAWYRISAGPSVTHHLRGDSCIIALRMIWPRVVAKSCVLGHFNFTFVYVDGTLTSNLGILEKT